MVVLDHHRYREIDRSKPKSSLDQFAERFGYELTEWERLVSLNDRRYIWGLMEDADVSYSTVRSVRRKDLEAQGYDQSAFEMEKQEFLAAKAKLKEFFEGQDFIFVHRTSLERNSFFKDLFHLPDESAYCKFKQGKMDLRRQNVLLLREKDSHFDIDFSGREEALELVSGLLYPLSENFWSGGQQGFCYAGYSIPLERDMEVSAALFTIETSAPCKRNLCQENFKKFTTFFLFPFAVSKDLEHSGKDWKFKPDEKDWHESTFALPLGPSELKEGKQGVNAWALCQNYAEYIYFHDYVRAFLFPNKYGLCSEHESQNEGVRFYRFKGIEIPGILEVETIEGKKLSAFINGINLLVYPPYDIGILAIEVGNDPELGESLEGKEKAVEEFRARQSVVSRGGDLLLFHNMVRRVYPSYFEKDDFDEQARNLEFPSRIQVLDLSGNPAEAFRDLDQYDFSRTFLQYDSAQKRYYPTPCPLIDVLLPGLSEMKTAQRLHPVIDDRMLIHTYLAFPEELLKKISARDRDIFFSLLLYVDNPGTRKFFPNYRYNPPFIESEMESHTYRGWEHFGTKIGFSRFSSAYLYFGHWNSLHRPFASMYYQMFLLILYFRSRLIQFSDEIAGIAKMFTDPGTSNDIEKKKFKGGLRRLHRRFMHFMNRYWFVEVTNQDQGIGIFRLMRDAFEIEPMYQQVKEEIERADELTELLHNEDVGRFNTRVGYVGGIFGFLAILTGFFGMNFDAISEGWGGVHVLFGVILFVGVLMLSLAIIVARSADPDHIVYCLFRFFRNPWEKFKR
ncbi:MAG: hypothetical protein C4530_09180 [Desulfobacteraceae bacterium]|nr:MAG: hypothetical protein C4530_09180 [Desulfobacteraceae bacterium]